MIDIHVLTLPTDRKDWFDQCIKSLPTWATVHVIQAKVGPIGPQRLAAFRQGQHPYVSYVDPDDWCVLSAWDEALAAMKVHVAEGYSGVCTMEMGHTGQRNILTPYKHKFCILTREFVESREALYRYDMLDRDIQATPEIKQLKIMGYHWRIHDSAGKKERVARAARNRA